MLIRQFEEQDVSLPEFIQPVRQKFHARETLEPQPLIPSQVRFDLLGPQWTGLFQKAYRNPKLKRVIPMEAGWLQQENCRHPPPSTTQPVVFLNH